MIVGLKRRERTTPVLISLHWLPIKARIIYKICTLVYQAIKFGKPVYLKELLSNFSTASDLTLRHNVQLDRLNEPRFNTEMGRKAFVNSALRLYDILPECVRISENYITFKKELKAYLFTEC
ncbi:uncharacterized protein LOC143039070 [Oratosquilla oratoria]|uniref:uncharacterized protein LOC143039070 n=1 Tax=Oratosquilla oratoria TaxID=337810 RepID=UPI003F75DD21